MPRTYLSIDLDYWFSGYDYEKIPRSISYIFDTIKHLKNKILVDDHDELLDHINCCNPERIIHLDFHQDIAYPVKGSIRTENVELNCGTFLYYVENRKNIDFEWYCPTSKCYMKGHREGLCVEPSISISTHKKNWIFRRQKTITGIPKLHDLESQICGIGVAISPDYCYCNPLILMNLSNQLINNHGYKYTSEKWLVNEDEYRRHKRNGYNDDKTTYFR